MSSSALVLLLIFGLTAASPSTGSGSLELLAMFEAASARDAHVVTRNGETFTACGRRLMSRVTRLCGSCRLAEGQLATFFCSVGDSDEKLVAFCCPNARKHWKNEIAFDYAH